MRLAILVVLTNIALAGPAPRGSSGTQVLDERFRSYRDGSDGSPRWLAVKGNWRMRYGTYEQRSPEYDCAAMLDTYLESSYRIDAEFEHLDGDPGVGFIFASRERDNTRFAQMARFDGAATFLAGYFENGEFTGTASGNAPRIAPYTPHTLTLLVDRDSATFSVLLDGTPVWGSATPPQRLVYPGGYVGLESSGGSVRFRRVRISATASASRSLDWVRHFALTPEGTFLVPSERTGTLALIDREGRVVRSIGAPASGGGQLRAPAAVSVLRDSLLVVTDVGGNCVHLFGFDGRWRRSTGWKGTAPGQFDGPVAVATSPQGVSFILEKANHRVQVLDDTLGPIGEFGKAELVDPLDLAADGANIYVVNTGLGRIERYRWSGRGASWVTSIPYGGGEGRGIAVRNGRIYLSLVNEVRCYDTTGVLLHTLGGRAIDFILPQGIVSTPTGVWFADDFGGRIVETTADLLDPAPAVTADSSRTVVEWSSAATGQGVLTIQETGEHFSETLFGTKHRLVLPAGRFRSTRHVQLAPTFTTVPPATRPSRPSPLPPLPVRGQKWYARLPMMAVIFANVNDSVPAGVPPQPLLPDSEISRIRRELADAVRFYWIHSGMRLFLDLETLVIHEPLERRKLYGTEWWYPPKDSVLDYYLRLNKRNLSDYSGILYLTCSQVYDTGSRSWVLGGKGGAFTNGVGTGKGYGISWWDVTRAHHNAGNNWLMVHEFNHQLDDIFMVSGYPEYWFNHISPTIGTAGPFGEHFDANRYILRLVPGDEWYDLRYTSLEQTGDRDQDGIPDNDPRLPVDEVRLGSDSTRVDTDSDGVDDADELAGFGWIVDGWGESSGTPIFPNLHASDTDGDGVPDGRDPLPCSALKTQAHRGVPTLLGSVDDRRASGSLTVRWASDTLAFEITMHRPRPVKIMLDLGNDGWFSGSDNILVTAAPEAPAEVKLQLFDGSSPTEWPHMNDALARKVSRAAVWTDHDGTTTFRVTFSGLFLEGKTVGVLVGLLAPFDDAGNKRYIDFFEPNRLFPLTLEP